MDLPWRRVLNLAYVLHTEGWSVEGIERLDELLATEEDRAAMVEERQDRDARQAAAAAGFNVDKMIERAWAARQAAEAQLALEAAE